MTIGPDGMDDIEREIAQWPRWKRLWNDWCPLWLFVPGVIVERRARRAYDYVMTHYWPYERFPHEWRSLWEWGKK